MLQIVQVLALAQDHEDHYQQRIPGRNPNTSLHPGIGDRLEKADQYEICGGRNALGH